MAELTADPPASSACCPPSAQAGCCEPAEKAASGLRAASTSMPPGLPPFALANRPPEA